MTRTGDNYHIFSTRPVGAPDDFDPDRGYLAAKPTARNAEQFLRDALASHFFDPQERLKIAMEVGVVTPAGRDADDGAPLYDLPEETISAWEFRKRAAELLLPTAPVKQYRDDICPQEANRLIRDFMRRIGSQRSGWGKSWHPSSMRLFPIPPATETTTSPQTTTETGTA